MDEIEFPYEDMSGMTQHADWGQVATAQLFGIVSYWTGFEGNPGPDKLFVIGCIVCEQGMSLGFTDKMIETVKGGIDTLEQQGYRAYMEEAGCQHFEQFDQFMRELDKETPHALKLADAITTRARLLSLA
jgi:hypothetical protein